MLLAVPEAPGWQPTWLLVNTQTFTAYLPIVSNVQCRLGHTIDDAVNDVPLAHVDLVQSQGSVLGYIFVEFKLRNIPSTLPFNRPGVPKQDGGRGRSRVSLLGTVLQPGQRVLLV